MAIYQNDMPFVVPGLSTSSSITSTPTSSSSSSSSSQDSVSDVSGNSENPVPERSESGEGLLGNPLHESTETKNKNKHEEREEAQSDLLHDFPYWLQEFRENLVDER